MSLISLEGKKGLVVGIANDQSIAYGCAKAFKQLGAEDLAITYLNEKAKSYVQPCADELGASIFMPLDVRDDAQMQAVFDEITKKWGKLDFVLHSIAFAPRDDLHARVVDCSKEGFSVAMDISCHSFIRMARLAEPLMGNDGTLLTVSFYGSEKVVENYNMMGPVKAALESVARYLAAELGPKGISVHALSPGPLKTRAASGIAEFDEMMEKATREAPMHQLVTIDDVGAYAGFLCSHAAKNVTGSVIYVDAGFNIVV
ncbi:MAG: enoyl-ACP reductase FabI [Geminicoccaceae bacterium]